MIRSKEFNDIFTMSLLEDYNEDEYVYDKHYLENLEIINNINYLNYNFISPNDLTSNKHIFHENDTVLMQGFEVFNLRKMCTLKEYLDDFIPKEENYEDFIWFSKVKTQIDSIINSTKSFLIKKDYIYVKVEYETRKGKIGRLYSNGPSIQNFPREVRAFLFENFYYDFDLVNCHYSFLAYYATKIAKIEVPSLLKYVTQREEILELKTKKDNIERSEAKQRFLITLNSTEKHSISLGFFCHDVFLDVRQCVESLFEKTLSDSATLIDFKKKIDINKYDFEFTNDAPYELKVKNMIYWLHTMETKVLLSLSTFIGQKCKEDYKNFLIHQRYPFNKKFSIEKNSEEIDISFIPFFDGAYVRTNNEFLNSQLHNYVMEFNDQLSVSLSSFIKFDSKKINLDNFKHLDIIILKKYLAIRILFQRLTTQKFNKLIKYLDIPKFSLPSNKIINKNNINEISSLVKDYRLSLYKKLLTCTEEEINALEEMQF
jgi:hypothetical protein